MFESVYIGSVWCQADLNSIGAIAAACAISACAQLLMLLMPHVLSHVHARPSRLMSICSAIATIAATARRVASWGSRQRASAELGRFCAEV